MISQTSGAEASGFARRARTKRHSAIGRAPVLPIKDGLNPSRVRLPQDAQPLSADEFVAHLISTQRRHHPKDDDHARAQRFASGEVRRSDGTALKPQDLIEPGQELWFYRMPAPEQHVPGHPRAVYAGPGCLVVNKPAFLATMPRGRHITETAVVRLRRATGNDELSPAHRLDRMTSGLLLFTTERRFRGIYQQLFATGAVHKTYEAIAPYLPDIARDVQAAKAAGEPGLLIRQRMYKEHGWLQTVLQEGEPNAVTLLSDVQPLDIDTEQAMRQSFARADHLTEGANYDYAPTRATTDLDQPFPAVPSAPLARYVLQPLTGKTHQLRLCMNSLGAPIVNDPVYPTVLPEAVGDRPDVLARPLMLRAVEMNFNDPVLNKDITLRTRSMLADY